MTHQELKLAILNNILSDDLLVLQYPDDTFMANHYIEGIAANKELEIKYVDSLDDVIEISNGLDNELSFGYLFVLKTENFAELKTDYSIYENTVIVCKKIDKKVSRYLFGYVIKLEKTEPWEIKQYVNKYCPGLPEIMVNHLINATGANTYRIVNILDQLLLFPEDERKNIYAEMANTPTTDLYFRKTSDFTKALLDKNVDIIKEVLTYRKCCDITPLYILTILLGELKNKAMICYSGPNSKLQPKELKAFNRPMDSRVFYAIKNSEIIPDDNDPGYKRKENSIRSKITFLSSIDLRLKLGQIELSDDYFTDYIINNILS